MRFSIRDLLLVTVIVALAVGWWVDRSHYRGLPDENARLKRRQEENEKLLSEMIEYVSRVTRNTQKTVGGSEFTTDVAPARPLPTSSPPAPNPPKE